MKTKPGADGTLYARRGARKIAILLAMAIGTLILAAVCINAGSSGMTPSEVLSALFGEGDATDLIIVRNIRLPRVLAAIIAGAGLSVAGCVMQSILKNPMASPSTLGVSNAAVFGANFAIIVLGAGAFSGTRAGALTVSNPYTVTVCAFVCALASALTVILLSTKQKFAPGTVVLAGLALGSLFSAGTTIIQYFSADTQVASAVFWSFGDLGRASYSEDIIMAVVVFAGFLYFFFNRWNYNALSNGEDYALSLGVRIRSLRFFSLLFASAICAVCVSFLGIIGFVGLIAPQAIKRFLGGDSRYLLPGSALAGAALLLLSDTVSRSLPSGIALPVGAVTSLLGGPAFLWILLRGRRGMPT